MMKSPVAVFLFSLATLDPCHGKVLWSSSPATYGPRESDKYILKTGYPVGNGKLGAIPFGAPGAEKVNLNVDSLWSGGPFEVENYSGGNPSGPIYEALPGIQAEIFENGTGNMSALLGNGTAYGSYRVLGNLTVEMENVGTYTEYRRQLDLSTGVHSTTFKARNDGDNDDDDGSAEYRVPVFCSYPDQVCVYDVSSDSILPNMTVGFENILVDQSLLDHSCGEGVARFSGITQAGSPEGMKYAAIARVAAGTTTSKGCSSGGSLELVPNGKRISIIISAETNYDQNHGNAESGWSFKGSDPEPIIEELSAAGSNKYYEELLERHIADYQELQGAFSLILPDPNGSEAVETGELLANYSRDYFSNSTNSTGAGDPFVESLLFDLARHLLISSSRPGSLPANLQGRWAEQLDPAWSADYHANINVQMNYWPADQTGLSVTQQPLWDHIEATWATRGRETARLLYDADGWVVHNEMNIFGFSAMKEDAGWANYAAAGAWIMQHVWDDFDYTRDADRLRRQGYPLLKGVADFWLSMLREDGFSGDGSLVAVPCNSPEHGPTTFGCAHYQQLVHQVFHAVLAAQEHLAPDASSDQEREGGEDEAEDNKAFVAAVTSALARLDKGYHISSWGGLKEWKLPESYGFDAPSTHRHLSHLSGWHPGHAVSSLSAGYASPAAQEAVRRTLLSRGDGDAPDANAGWAKVWRAACWARLNDTARAHEHLRHAAAANLAPSANGLSMYAGADPPFQIDANFGFAGAVLSMLVVDLPSADVGPGARERSVVLGPAIPPSWGGGKVKGLRLRGGWVVDFGWDEDGVVDGVEVVSRGKGAAAEKVRVVDVKGRHLALLEVEGEM